MIISGLMWQSECVLFKKFNNLSQKFRKKTLLFKIINIKCIKVHFFFVFLIIGSLKFNFSIAGK